ncbi:homoserine kinase [Clostridium sp. MSJ-11]|uniref:Homoserine kinase n=1 Tax=Clostridium mobile TaxID=2841512 RepID=A0ABS6EJV2_9CLOT|nr:homoserine kinase [Clostridium mobile]MBU5485412.1 homoserine kinase [Clostridium mobile]
MVEVIVPATSANLGPGFDCLGVALNFYNKFYIEENDYSNDKEENNLAYVSAKKLFDKVGYKNKDFNIRIEGNIPQSRGLGSSATCIVGGLIGANKILGDILSKEEIIKLATEIEGHPDNVTPAIIGGVTTAIFENEKIYYEKLYLKEGIKFCALTPDFKLSTSEARSVLPSKVDYTDAVFNVGRVALTISSLINGNFEQLRVSCEDKLHQPYRSKLIRNYDSITAYCKELNSLGVFLSGAGPTIMVMLEESNNYFLEEINKYLITIEDNWEVRELEIDYLGAKVNVY